MLIVFGFIVLVIVVNERGIRIVRLRLIMKKLVMVSGGVGVVTISMSLVMLIVVLSWMMNISLW